MTIPGSVEVQSKRVAARAVLRRVLAIVACAAAGALIAGVVVFAGTLFYGLAFPPPPIAAPGLDGGTVVVFEDRSMLPIVFGFGAAAVCALAGAALGTRWPPATSRTDYVQTVN